MASEREQAAIAIRRIAARDDHWHMDPCPTCSAIHEAALLLEADTPTPERLRAWARWLRDLSASGRGKLYATGARATAARRLEEAAWHMERGDAAEARENACGVCGQPMAEHTVDDHEFCAETDAEMRADAASY